MDIEDNVETNKQVTKIRKHKTKTVHIRVTEEDYLELKLKAYASHLTVTDYIIQIAFEKKLMKLFLILMQYKKLEGYMLI